MVILLYDSFEERFPDITPPDWYPEARSYLRGNVDHGKFGLYLYEFILNRTDISTVLNIGTARGHSAVCAAKALEEANRKGVVHTIDIIKPDQAIKWHADKHPPTDPLSGIEITMEELVRKFHDPHNNKVPMHFHTGDSLEVLANWDREPPDLVFHDGSHTYKSVITEIQMTTSMGESLPVSVFDDCFLFNPVWEYRPFLSEYWYRVDSVPKLGGLTRRLRQFSLSKTRLHGIERAVTEAFEWGKWDALELTNDENHAPLATLLPEKDHSLNE